MNINTLDHLFFDNQSFKEKEYKPGEHVFSQGDTAHNIFAVKKGQVKLERYTAEGRVVVMHVAEDGESFAEAALFSDIYHCNAIVTLPTIIHIYDKMPILDTLGSDQDKAKDYIALLSRQIRQLRSKLELRNILSARDRILQYFYLTSQGGDVVVLDKNLKDIAADIGLAHETFYRELAKLEKDGLITREKNKILLF
jgi:CRP-like cAMP-binding protein